MRSGLRGRQRRDAERGIISACAERSTWTMKTNSKPWDHLRVCGAVLAPATGRSAGWGSSPRVRSGPFPPFRKRLSAGIISACAERSWNPGLGIWRARDHLRVCGAVLVNRLHELKVEGSSPRVRSGPGHSNLHPSPCRIISACAERSSTVKILQTLQGIISACAERSFGLATPIRSARDHLRVCGAV